LGFDGQSRPVITISGLSKKHVALLDFIYAHESYDDLMEWTHSLPRKMQLEVLTLIKLILLETIEEEMIKPMTRYTDAERIINRIKRNIK